ncbi:superoxide dismutase [Mn], mitochondrial isoform X1 [Cotesia glomerata]|uniref:Superoxide dismutase n=2 Tax=Cotesia glomerata TaxID=32391 RepID=A0AAV7I948_COTGL|nr:superoxide dismutase [Mn], mitochondrial isoform X1 [Cotesia glomerata]KAH0547192.1 Superoxide dismutase [Mn], mitochondrial [Cotesia glomerata]
MFAIKRIAAAIPRTGIILRKKHTLPDLPYDYKALEPIICAEIMQLHHSKHHATYVNNLNVAEEKLKEAVAKGDVNTQIALAPAIKFNGGGHLNHSIFWNNLSPSSSKPDAALMKKIEADFSSLDEMKKRLSESTVAIQGSGWGWLGYNQKEKRLQIATCANQDPLQATTGLVPLLGIDVWEHAYYLQYKNVRPDYVKAIFDIVNWNDVSARFKQAGGS